MCRVLEHRYQGFCRCFGTDPLFQGRRARSKIQPDVGLPGIDHVDFILSLLDADISAFGMESD
jgi:hypothetical protein